MTKCQFFSTDIFDFFPEIPGFTAISQCIMLAAELYVTARVYTLAIHFLMLSSLARFKRRMGA